MCWCAIPDSFAGMFDMSSVFSCPTLFSMPHFYLGDDRIVASSGQVWDADPVRDVWTYDVEPFSGFTVGAHKTYQVNNLVSRTAHAYPDLWVKAGSGAETGRAADFVTVPSNWMRMWWMPTKSAALALRGLVTAQRVLYWTLVLAFPVIGFLLMVSSGLFLRCSSSAKTRRRAFNTLQESRAPKLRLATADEAPWLARVGSRRSGAGQVLPLIESEEGDEEGALDGDADDFVLKVARPGGGAEAWPGHLRASELKVHHARSSSRQLAIVIGRRTTSAQSLEALEAGAAGAGVALVRRRPSSAANEHASAH